MLIASRYRLERKLAEDGLAATWQAEDSALGRRVRLRMLREDRLQDADAFRREVRAEAQNTSVATARVLDGGDDEVSGLPFVVYEWADVAPVVAGADEKTQPIQIPTPTTRTTRTPPASAPRAQPVQRADPVRRTTGRRWDRLLLVLLLAVPLIIGVVAISSWISQPVRSVANVFRLSNDDAALPTPAAAPTAVPAAPQPAAAAPAATAPPARPSPTAVQLSGERRRVANTDGQGVALRREPDGERFPGRGYSEGDIVTLLEERGRWSRIRGADGREGWVLSVTLVR